MPGQRVFPDTRLLPAETGDTVARCQPGELGGGDQMGIIAWNQQRKIIANTGRIADALDGARPQSTGQPGTAVR